MHPLPPDSGIPMPSDTGTGESAAVATVTLTAPAWDVVNECDTKPGMTKVTDQVDVVDPVVVVFEVGVVGVLLPHAARNDTNDRAAMASAVLMALWMDDSEADV